MSLPIGFANNSFKVFSAFSSHCRKHHGKPLLQAISVTGFFIHRLHVPHHTGPMASCPIQRKNQLWSSNLLKDTSATTGTRTHTLLIRNTTA